MRLFYKYDNQRICMHINLENNIDNSKLKVSTNVINLLH